MSDQLLNMIANRWPLRALDPGDFAAFKAKGMRFTLRAWEAEGFGHVSLMTAKGFFGLMQMDTLIVNPKEIDMPLYSYDRIFAMGNDTLIAELYDTTVGGFSAPALDKVVAEASALPERDPGKHWYDTIRLPQSISKKGKKAQRGAFDQLAAAHLRAWMNADCPPLTDKAAKAEKTAAYVNGLLTNGGPSTDVFLQAMGREKTERLFRTLLFCTD